MVWSESKILKLIEFFQDHEFLYNPRLPDYRNRSFKQAKLNEIARLLGVSIDEVRRKWANLRTQFMKECSKMKKQGKNDYFDEVKWRFFKPLQFLDDYSNSKNNTSGLMLQVQEEDVSIYDEKESISNYLTMEDIPKRGNCRSFNNNNRSRNADKQEDRAVSSYSNYFSKLTSELDNIENEDESFCRMLCSEMKMIKRQDIKRRLKRDLLDNVLKAQEEEFAVD